MAFLKKKTTEELEIPPPPVRPMRLPETPDQLPTFEELREAEMPPIPPPMSKERATIPPPEPEMPSFKFQSPPMPTMAEPPRPRINPEILKRFEEEQYIEEKAELEELEKREFTGKPLYVLISQYKQVISEANEARNILKANEENSMNLNTIKNKTDKEFEVWRQNMEDIQRKIIFINKTLFER